MSRALLAGLALFLLGAALGPWQEVLREDGVTVSLRERSGSALPEVRAVVRIDATPWEVLAVIRDVERHPEWVIDCVEARVLREESDAVWVVYQRTHLPWPFSDRDTVSRTDQRVQADGEIRVSWSAVVEPQWSEREGIVRMPTLEGSYDMRPLESGATEVEYRLFLDPAGVVPDWIARRFVVDVPRDTLLRLRTRVPESRGRYDAWLRERDPAHREP